MKQNNTFRTPHLLVAAVLTALLALTACTEDELKGHVPLAETVSIVSNNLDFPAAGGSATVTVSDADTPVTAAVSESWCSVSVDGTTITVTAEPNAGYEGRTALLTLWSGSHSRQLPVQQHGMVLGSMPVRARYAPMEGSTFSYTIRHDLPMTVSTDVPWLHASMDGETLTVTADSNTDGHLRRGMVYSESAGQRDSLTVSQYDLANDILGSYYMMGYYGGQSGTPVATRFDIVQHDGSICMHWTNYELWLDTYLPVAFDESTATLFLPSVMRFYEGSGSSDTGYFYDADGMVAYSSDYGAEARLTWNSSTGFNSAPLTLRWPGHQMGGFIIRSLRGNGLVNSVLAQMADPVLIRVGPEGSTIND